MWYLSHFTNTVLLEPCKILFILIHLLLLSRKTKPGILTKCHLPLLPSFLLCSMSCEANMDRLQFRGFLTLWLPIRFHQWEIQGHELQEKEKVEVFLFLFSSCQMMVLAFGNGCILLSASMAPVMVVVFLLLQLLSHSRNSFLSTALSGSQSLAESIAHH